MPPVKRPKLIGLDLDGTIVTHENVIPDETVAALRECHDNGIALAFLTGRRPLTARPHIERVGRPAHVATNSGCLLWEYPSWEQLGQRHLPADLVEPLYRITEPHAVNFFVDASVTGFEFMYIDRKPSPVLDQYMERYGRNSRRTTDVSELTKYEITQMAMPGPDDLVEELRDRISQAYDGRLLVMSVRWPLLETQALEVFSSDANKGTALKFFADRLGIDQADTFAAGDDINDLAMLEWAGYSVAMPGASKAVLPCADEQLKGNGAADIAGLLRTIARMQ